jgi:hypothetical protein
LFTSFFFLILSRKRAIRKFAPVFSNSLFLFLAYASMFIYHLPLGKCGWAVRFWNDLHPVFTLRMNGAIPLFYPIWLHIIYRHKFNSYECFHRSTKLL